MRSFKHLIYGGLLAAVMSPAMANDGEKIYTKGGAQPGALACITCHMADGKGMDAGGFPNIAGYSAGYLAKQVHDFKKGTRENAIMMPIATALTEAEIDAVAQYMASLDKPEVPEITRAKTPEGLGESLAIRGDWSRSIPECVACHGPGGVGVGEVFPPLAGQGSNYLVSQLRAWQQGTRKNDQNDLMGHIARSLTEEEITAVAAYFSGLGK